ncbi:hypothetical protein ACV56Z_00740 [Staphylococcus aureus]
MLASYIIDPSRTISDVNQLFHCTVKVL